MTNDDADLFYRFETDAIEPGSFGHREHVQVAYDMLRKYPYLDACSRYMSAIQMIAARAGAPEKFNVTITLAFLSLIAERIQATPASASSDDFLADNPDLLSMRVLHKWYAPEQLTTEFARTHFLMPS